MKHVFSLLVMLMACVMLAPATADAGIVLDNYSSSTSATNVALDRASTGTFVQDEGFQFRSFGVLSYEKDSGTFSDFGSLFSIGLSATAGSSYKIEIADQDFNSITSFTVNDASTGLDFSGIGSATGLNFLVSRISGGSTARLTLGGGAFTAVPEPTSLALVGLAVGGLGLRRRRRS